MNNIFSSWQFFAIGSAFFAGLTAIFGKIGVKNVNSNLATFIRTIIILFVISLLVTVRKEWEGVEHLSKETWLFLVLSGIATGASWVCYYRALQIGEASKVAPVDKLSVVFVIVLSLIFLGEKLTLKSGFGALFIVLGTLLLAL